MMETEFHFEDGKLTATRIYDSSIEDVFDAWVETSKTEVWWGCAQCVNVRSEIEKKVGGKYNHHMTLEGIGEIPGFATLVEYDPPNKLAYETSDPTNPEAKMRVSVDFVAVDQGTKVTLIHSGIPDMRVDGDVELREVVQGGWTAAFEKLNGLFVNS